MPGTKQTGGSQLQLTRFSSVHVFYNSRVGVSSKPPNHAPQKLPLIPMKESKEVRKSEWTQGDKKLKRGLQLDAAGLQIVIISCILQQ